MAQNYRKAIGSTVWHFSPHCTTWPARNYIESQNPQEDEVCSECTALQEIGVRTCPVIVNGKECGLDLILQSSGVYYCALGHRTRIIPRPK
jgi:hypothetical protein